MHQNNSVQLKSTMLWKVKWVRKTPLSIMIIFQRLLVIKSVIYIILKLRISCLHNWFLARRRRKKIGGTHVGRNSCKSIYFTDVYFTIWKWKNSSLAICKKKTCYYWININTYFPSKLCKKKFYKQKNRLIMLNILTWVAK